MIRSRTQSVLHTSDRLLRLTTPRLSRQRQPGNFRDQPTVAGLRTCLLNTPPPLGSSLASGASGCSHTRTTCRAADLSAESKQRYIVKQSSCCADVCIQPETAPYACRKDIDEQIAWLAIPVRAHSTSCMQKAQ